MPTTAYTDGSFIYPSQNGARQVSLPLVQDQEYYCTQTVRQMQQLAQFWEPSMYQRTAYTNVLTYSDQASSSAWTKVAVTVAAESDTDAEGGTTASFLAETSANSAHSIAQAATGTGVVTFGAFVRAKERTFVRLRINNSTDGNLAIAIFNLTLGTVESGTGTIKKMPGGWLYCTVSGTATVSGNTCYVEIASNASTTSYAGTTGSGLYTWRLNAVFASSVSPVPATTASTPAIYTGSASVQATVPLVDPDDPLSFLVDETPPDQSTLELGVCQWQRTFCRASKQTITPSSIIVSKPAPLGSGSTILGTDVFFHQPEIAYNTYDIYSVSDVTFDYGNPTFAISSGTYTITAGSYTTASLNYNATAGEVQTALNLLPSVVTAGLTTVTGAATVGAGFRVVFGSTATYGTLNMNMGALSAVPRAFFNYIGNISAGSGDGGGGGLSPYVEKPYRSYRTYSTPLNPITSGTYTLTYFRDANDVTGQTTSSLNFDATPAQIGAALNALTYIQDRGGVVMTDGPGGPSGYNIATGSIYIAFYFATPVLTLNTSALSPPPVTATVTTGVGNYDKIQYIFLTPGDAARYITAPGHGIIDGDTIFLSGSYISATSPATVYTSTFYVPVTRFTVSDSSNIIIEGGLSYGYMTAATISKLGRRSFVGYSPGPQNVRSRKITDYYLPGFTPDVATFENIPIIESQNDGEPFFSAMIAGGDINYSVGELGVWRGPILYQNTVKVAAVDLGTYLYPYAGGSLFIELSNSQIASFPAITSYSFSNFTIELWVQVKSSPTPENFGRIVDFFGPASFNCINWVTGNKIEFNAGVFPGAVTSNADAITLDQWDHFAFRREGTTFTILKNGVSIKTASVANTVFNLYNPSGSNISFGRGNAENLSGFMSDFRMWNKAVPDSTILANYNRRLRGNEAGLVCYYRLNESNNVFADVTGGSEPLTINLSYWVNENPDFDQ